MKSEPIRSLIFRWENDEWIKYYFDIIKYDDSDLEGINNQLNAIYLGLTT